MADNACVVYWETLGFGCGIIMEICSLIPQRGESGITFVSLDV